MKASKPPARLALEDGSLWVGRGFGATGTQVGEVVFNTSMTGYQEILTDPSYAGQMVVMTTTQIGNTGINHEDHEASDIFIRGFIVRELSPCVSNWRANLSLANWLQQKDIVGIENIDTRALTRRLREKGSLKGVLTTDASPSDNELIEQARAWNGTSEIDLVKTVTCSESYTWADPSEDRWIPTKALPSTGKAYTYHVVAYDYGIKHNILRRLASHGCRITVVPASTPAKEAMALKPDGIFLSNGPGDPAILDYAVKTTKDLLGKVPIFGICLGHQILGQAFGGETFKLKFGHHGGNQPVKHLPTGRVEISAHNHNFAVDPESLPETIEVTHINLNDGCCEGMRHTKLPALSIQYHPEAAPGPHDADPLFAEFIQIMAKEAL